METQPDFTHAYAEPGSRSIIDAIHPVTHLGLWSGETLDQVRVRYPRAEIVDFNEWLVKKGAEQDTPVEWIATTAERYDEMLNVLPPVEWSGHVFGVGEPIDHHAVTGQPRFDAYRRIGDDYFVSSRPMTAKEIRDLRRIPATAAEVNS